MLAKRPQSWTTRYLGLPFMLGASGPGAYDCWGLVCWVYRDVYGVVLPPLITLRDRGYDEQVAAGSGDWSPVEGGDHQSGDLVTFKGAKGSIHVGLVVAQGWMLHTRRGASSSLNRLTDAPWAGTFLQAYRHKEIGTQ